MTAGGHHPPAPPALKALRPGEGRFLAEAHRVAYLEGFSQAKNRQTALPELILEKDPARAVGRVFGNLDSGRTVALGNPDWPSSVKEAVVQQLADSQPPDLAPEGEILIPTGGSTGGNVKLARHTWRSLASAAAGLHHHLGPGPIHSLCTLPYFHVSGFMPGVRALASGGQVWFSESSDVGQGKLPDSFQPESSCLSVVPTQLRRWLPDRRPLLERFRRVFLGGAAMTRQELITLKGTTLPLCLSYGMTETAAMITLSSPGALAKGDFSQGLPLPHVSITIGEADRVRITSTSLFRGIWGFPTRPPGAPFEPGDRGIVDSSGRFTFLGRADTVINTGGEKVDPLHVGAALRNCPEIMDTWIGGIPDPDWGERVGAAVVIRSGMRFKPEALRRKLKQALAPHEIPSLWVEVQDIPRNRAGKIDRERMRALFREAT